MASTAAIEIPRQFVKDGPPSQWETAWEEALDAVVPFLTPELIGRLHSAANGKAIGAYDFGVEWGLGHLPEIEGEAPPDVRLADLKAVSSVSSAFMAGLLNVGLADPAPGDDADMSDIRAAFRQRGLEIREGALA